MIIGLFFHFNQANNIYFMLKWKYDFSLNNYIMTLFIVFHNLLKVFLFIFNFIWENIFENVFLTKFNIIFWFIILKTTYSFITWTTNIIIYIYIF